MRAMRYTSFGPAFEVLSLAEVPTPKPRYGEVLVRLVASGVNPHDTKKRSGWLGVELPPGGVIPHSDGGGIIAQRRIEIARDETLHSLMRKCKVVAADAIVETVSRFREGTVAATANPAEEGSYFSFPEREDVRRYRSLGRALR